MGLLDGVLGNASKIDASKIQQEFRQLLAEGERVEHAYQLIRTTLCLRTSALCLLISKD
jgi:Bacterial PH domain